jgi:mycofactocin biosynthetic radical S-adenosylmethionine protein MftC
MNQHRFHLNVTEKCNLRCVHCYWEEYGKNPDPSLETVGKILDQFKQLASSYFENRRHMLTLGGGEPTLRADLEQIIQLAVRRGFRVRLVTNATSLDQERALSLRKSGVEVAQVSLDGATEQTHDRVRGRGNWQRSMAGIQALKRARVFTVLSYVLLPGINMEEAPTLLDLARTLRVAGVKFARPVREGQAAVNAIRIQGDYLGTFRRILDHAQAIRYRRLLLFFDPLAHLLPVEASRKVAGLWGLATDLCQCNNTELIEVNGGSGDVYYCRIRAKLGNLWETPLPELWHHHTLLNQIRRKTPNGSCKKCGVWDGCRGGCPAVVYGNTGQVLLQDADCSEVQKQPAPLVFPGVGHSNPRVLSNTEKILEAGDRLKFEVYRLSLR